MSATTFANHRGVVPMLWVFAGLAVLEMLAVHLFVALKWPAIGWPLTILSGLSIVWLVSWIRSWSRLPHELLPDRLRLHMGSLRSVDVPLAQIAAIEVAPSLDRIREVKARKLVPLAHPNRLILLTASLPGRRAVNAVAILVDDPAAFDQALAGKIPAQDSALPA